MCAQTGQQVNPVLITCPKIQLDTRYNQSYTQTMKTAISIPDTLFREAELYAKSRGFSRSELFSKAVAQFLEANPSDLTTQQLDTVYASEPAKLNKALANMQFSSIEKEEW